MRYAPPIVVQAGTVLAVLAIALDRAERQPQRERGVGIGLGAEEGEAGVGQLAIGRSAAAPRPAARRSVRTSRAGLSTSRASRIIGSSEASMALTPPSANLRRTATSASFVPRTSSAARCCGDLPAITFCDQLVVRALACSTIHAQRVGQQHGFADRRRSAPSENSSCLSESRFDSRILAQPVGVGLGGFLGQPDQRAGDAEQLAVERLAAFQQVVVVANRRPGGQRLVDRRAWPRRKSAASGGSLAAAARKASSSAFLRSITAGSCRPASPPSRALRPF